MEAVLTNLTKEVNNYFNKDSYYIFHKPLEDKYAILLQDREHVISHFESFGYKCEIDKPYLTPIIHIYKTQRNDNISPNTSIRKQNRELSYHECLGYAAHQYTNYLLCGGPLI